jgi:hypothetical protein
MPEKMQSDHIEPCIRKISEDTGSGKTAQISSNSDTEIRIGLCQQQLSSILFDPVIRSEQIHSNMASETNQTILNFVDVQQ